MQCRHFPDRNRTNNAISNLHWGTGKENASDRSFHGTSMIGTKNPSATFAEKDILAIRSEYASGWYSQRRLARKHNTCQTTISAILRRETWKHIA